MNAVLRRGLAARGFALAEAMVAVAILGLIGMLTFGAFARAMDGRDQAESMSGYYHEVRQAMLRMTREIPMAFVSEHRNCDDRRTDTNFVVKSGGNGTRLDFTAFSHRVTRADANESDQEELSYFVGNDPEHPGQTALIRRAQARIDDEPDDGGREQVMAENVTDLEFELYDSKEDRWVDEWDARGLDYKGRLPMFVKIVMKVKNPAGDEETFTTKTRLFLKKTLSPIGFGVTPCRD